MAELQGNEGTRILDDLRMKVGTRSNTLKANLIVFIHLNL
jgi:hypothetical protein